MGLSGFDKSKLKSRLKMAQSRINLLKNKTSNSIKIQKRQVASLLRDQKDESARIKVENIIRDDYLLEALDILMLFCDLLLTRIQLISESKTCPHDMKEAVSTIIYAAPRVEIPEFMDVREQFKLKFGKNFVANAMENRDLSVNQRVMFKLGLKVPKPYLCIQYLKNIAKENDIEWDSEEDEQEVAQNQFPQQLSGGSSNAQNVPQSRESMMDRQHNPDLGYPTSTQGTGYRIDGFDPHNPHARHYPSAHASTSSEYNPNLHAQLQDELQRKLDEQKRAPPPPTQSTRNTFDHQTNQYDAPQTDERSSSEFQTNRLSNMFDSFDNPPSNSNPTNFNSTDYNSSTNQISNNQISSNQYEPQHTDLYDLEDRLSNLNRSANVENEEGYVTPQDLNQPPIEEEPSYDFDELQKRFELLKRRE